jgi:hypothetical protein
MMVLAIAAAQCALIPGEIIAVDGKTLRRSHDRNAGLAARHLVSALATGSDVVLGIENTLYRRLDMIFGEYECRLGQPAAGEKLAVLRHIALSRLKQDDAKFSLRNKRNNAGWDHRYLAKLLFDVPGSPPPTSSSGSSNIPAS